MPSARLARETDEIGCGLERARIELRPAHRVVDVLHRGRIGRLVARAEIERDRHNAVRGHELVAQLLCMSVLEAPGAAVTLNQSRKWPISVRLMHPGQQWLVAVPEVLNVFDIEVCFLGFKDRSGHAGHPVQEAERTQYLPRSAAKATH